LTLRAFTRRRPLPSKKKLEGKSKAGEVTENHTHLSHLPVPPAAGVPPRPPGPLTEIEDRRACDSDRRVAVNNIQVILVCGRPGDRGGCLGAKVQSVF